MTVYAYKATGGDRRATRGTIAADSPRQARELLRSRGLTVEELTDHQATPTTASASPATWWTLHNSPRVVQALRELATLLGAGIPVLEALDTLVKQHRGWMQTSLLAVRDRISEGAGLAEAMAEQPRIFDPLAINMVEVGEQAGNLDVVLDQLAGFKERSQDLKDRVTTALIYPAFVLTASVGVTIFLMTVVVPMLLDSLVEAGRELPWITRVVKGISDVLVAHGWLLGLAGVAIAAVVVGVLRTQRGQRAWHALILATPGLGALARKQAIARIALVTSTLMKSGIVFLKAIDIAGRSTQNLVLREALETAAQAVRTGRDIGEALGETQAFPPLVIQVFAVGQQSGRLEEMLDRLAIDYDRQVASASGRLATILEPALILILAVIVGCILFATILPILEAGNVL